MSFVGLGDHTHLVPHSLSVLSKAGLNPKAYKYISGHAVAAYPCCGGPDLKNTMAGAFHDPF